MHHNTQMFLVMDGVGDLPEHIQQTFRLFKGKSRWETELEVEVAFEGDTIDLKAPGYIIMHANDSWHKKEAAVIASQIASLKSDAVVMWLPVEVEVKQDHTDKEPLVRLFTWQQP